ncbi:MAG: CPBP family intramembrane metalloprotease [Alphaproteobacteria bacterium]|nr:CPBP family intramembrane metalloprotease [Alphaproteobacteria bacterium]MDE2074807.1 CPBP family intramembrane metalloprotease [Alphaproteobacteria bacterium]
MELSLGAEPFRIRILPIIVVIVLGMGIPVLAAMSAYTLIVKLHLSVKPGDNYAWLFIHHGFQLLLALIAIAILKRLVPADYGLHLPRGKSYLGPAILWGLAFGLLMTLCDYFPVLLAHSAPQLDYPLTTQNVTGWLAFEGLYVGPTEEIPFRALLVSFLAATMPGRVRAFGYTMNAAGVLVALIFALAHVSSFWTEAWPLALAQQAYAFALGVLYAYWLEKSGSVLAPAIGHNISDVSEYALVYLWIALHP